MTDIEHLEKVCAEATIKGVTWFQDHAPTDEVLAQTSGLAISVVAKVNPMAEWDVQTANAWCAFIATFNPVQVSALLAERRVLIEERDGRGWLYISDDGPEWSADHPIESGQVPDARMVRPATAAALLDQLKDAWSAYHDGLASEARLGRRLTEAEAELSRIKGERDAMRGALEWIEGREPATQEVTLAHEMAGIARSALQQGEPG